MDSTRLSCLIIDDEPAAIRILEKYVGKIEFLSLEETFRSPLDAMVFLNNQSVDVIFLDINMPELSGLEMLASLAAPPAVILTTAYSEYALEGYDIGVVDYLLKPIAFNRFLKAVNRAADLVQSSPPSVKPEEKQITLQAGGALYSFRPQDLFYVEALGNYVKVRTRQQTIVVKSGLQDFMNTHASLRLFRVHKSFAVNIRNVDKVAYYHAEIQGFEIPIGRKYRKDFRAAFSAI